MVKTNILLRMVHGLSLVASRLKDVWGVDGRGIGELLARRRVLVSRGCDAIKLTLPGF